MPYYIYVPIIASLPKKKDTFLYSDFTLLGLFAFSFISFSTYSCELSRSMILFEILLFVNGIIITHLFANFTLFGIVARFRKPGCFTFGRSGKSTSKSESKSNCSSFMIISSPLSESKIGTTFSSSILTFSIL